MENNKGTKAYFGVKADAVIKFLIRWTVFFSFIFALLIAAQIWVKKNGRGHSRLCAGYRNPVI